METDPDRTIEVCRVADAIEARLVLSLLQDHDIIAMSDETSANPLFGGLPFESGHRIYVYEPFFAKARELLEHYPHFHHKTETTEANAAEAEAGADAE